jgi:nucleotide-binding universal stress UspA family protein
VKKIEKILVATDFSECSEGAFNEGARLARQLKAALLLVHVVEPVDVALDVVPVMPVAYIERELTRALTQIADRARKEGIPVETDLLRGSPPDEIVRAAVDSGCDLIAMGTHGRRGVARLLTGSVTERVLRASPVPLLAVRLRAAADQKKEHPAEESRAA